LCRPSVGVRGASVIAPATSSCYFSAGYKEPSRILGQASGQHTLVLFSPQLTISRKASAGAGGNLRGAIHASDRAVVYCKYSVVRCHLIVRLRSSIYCSICCGDSDQIRIHCAGVEQYGLVCVSVRSRAQDVYACYILVCHTHPLSSPQWCMAAASCNACVVVCHP